MNVLIIGSGKGSWEMRAVQLGAAIGARVRHEPVGADVDWSDVVVLVKRAGNHWAQTVRGMGRPIVWDALDFWQQPNENSFGEARAIELLHQQIGYIKPVLTICATQAMAAACGGVYLPHQSWAGLVPTPVRQDVRTVAYDGNPQYLGRWHDIVRDACRARMWQFVISPPDLSAVDLLVSFRDGPRDGWICRQWKSGVKAVNAICAGRPFISQACAALDELQPDGAMVETPEALAVAFDEWADADRRGGLVERARMKAPSFTLEAVAAQYTALLARVVSREVAA